MTKASVSPPPSSAVVRSRMPSAPARPRRSARPASCGGPVSSASTSVRLLPETAIRCSMSVARNASSSSGGTREVSPTTSAGSSARASGESPSVAVRSPARSRPASRWTALGAPVTRGGPPLSRTTAATRSPSRSGGARRPWTRRRVDGSSRSQAARSSGVPGWTVTRTGARVTVVVPPGPVTRVTSASRTTDAGASAAPRTRGRVSRGSPVTVTSAVASAYCRASAGTGPRRTSAPCSPATAPAAAPHNSAATTAPTARRPRHVTARGGDAVRSPGTWWLSPVSARPRARGAAQGVAPGGAPAFDGRRSALGSDVRPRLRGSAPCDGVAVAPGASRPSSGGLGERGPATDGTGGKTSGPRRDRGAPRGRPPGAGVTRRRAPMSRATATREAAAQARATMGAGASRARAAAAQAARAGGTRRRSGGPSWRGCEAPRGDAAVAWTGMRVRVGSVAVMAGPAGADRRTGAHRCRSPRGVRRWSGNLRAGCGSR